MTTPDYVTFETTELGGKTIRFSIDDFSASDGTEITSDATVTINLYDQNDTLVTVGSVQQYPPPDASTYYADITLPMVTRITLYVAKLKGVYNTKNYESIGWVWVAPF